MFEEVKKQAAAIYNSAIVQQVKEATLNVGQNVLINKLSGGSSYNQPSKLNKIDSKLSEFGIDLFNPEEVMYATTGSIRNEHSDREAMRAHLDSFREELERDAEKKDGIVLSRYISALSDRAQDAFTTAVTDGVIKEMTPSSIKNPIAAQYGGGYADESIVEYYEDDYDDIITESDIEEETAEERKKGFLDTAINLFNISKDIAIDVGAQALENKLSGNKVSSKDLLLSTVLSPVGLTPTSAYTSPGYVTASANLVNITTTACIAGFRAALAPAQENPEEANSVGFLNRLQSVASAMVSSITNPNVEHYGYAYTSGNYNPISSTTQPGYYDHFKNPMDVLHCDISGNLLEKTTENVIARTAEDVSPFAKEPVFNTIASTMSDAYGSALSGTASNGTELYGGVVEQETPGPFSTASITTSITEQAVKIATDSGDTDALVKNVIEQNVSPDSGAKYCNDCAKSCNQTTNSVKNLLVTAEILDVNLNTIEVAELKSPSETNNMLIDESKKINNNEMEPDESQDLGIPIYDLVEFGALTTNGTMLAKVLMDDDGFNQCASLYNTQNVDTRSLVA